MKIEPGRNMAVTSGPPEHGAELPPAPPSKRRRRWLEIVGVVALVLTGLGILGLLMGPPSGDGTLLEEDFEGEPYRFSTDSDRFVDLSVVDGEYRATIRDGSIPQFARHVFAHTHGSVVFAATVTLPGTDEGAVFASVGCWAGESAYLLLLSADGEVALLETIRESTGERQLLTEPIPTDAIRPPGEPNRMRIDCVGGGKDDTVVSGTVNGDPVVSVAVPTGYDSFDAVGFFLVAEQGGRFTIDDVSARAERPSPGMTPVPPIAIST